VGNFLIFYGSKGCLQFEREEGAHTGDTAAFFTTKPYLE
jgi:hypothetical protein